MNESLQELEIKVENEGATPQGKLFADEWNIVVEALKKIDNDSTLWATQSWVEEQQYLTEITSGMIESVLGYQPYDGDTNRLGFLTSSALNGYATQSWVNTALAGYLPLSGGTINGVLSVESVLRMSDLDGTYKILLQRDTSGNILFGGGFATNNMYIDADVLRIRANNTIFSRNVTAPTFTGNLTGNADSATKLATPRTIWGQSFDGTGNVSGRLDDVEFINFVGSWLQIGLERNESSAVQNIKIQSHGGKDLLINPTGNNVSIGGSTANAKLHVYGGLLTESQSGWSGAFKGGAKSAVYAAHSDGYGLSVMSTAATTDNIYLFRVWRGSLTGTSGTGVAVLDVKANGTIQTSGNLVVGGGITMYSQRSLKNILSYDGLSLEQLSVIKPIKFTWKDGRDNRYHVGGVADDVETVVPEVVYSTNDFLTMDYGNAGFYVAASLIKPVIHCYNKVEKHEKDIDYLKRENVAIKKENEALRKEINQLRQSA